MSTRTIVLAAVGAILLLALIVELVRRRRLRIGYSLLWLFIAFMGLVLVLFREPVALVSQLMGLRAPSSLLFSMAILFAIVILLEHSLTLTILWRQDKNLAQEQALLEWRVRQLEARLEELGVDLAEEAELLMIPEQERELERKEGARVPA